MSANDTTLGTSGSTHQKRFLVRLTAVSAGGTFLDGYVLGIIGTVIVAITAELQLTVFWEGLIAASALIGIFLGAPLGGWLADRFGRKPVFVADLLLFIVASLLQLWANSPEMLVLTRLIMGVAVGAEYSVGWPLLAEFSPARLRGRLVALSEAAWFFGFMVAFLLGYVLVRTTDLHWRTILATSTILAVLLLIGRIGLPESPRWLWNKGRREEAMVVARRFLDTEEDIADVQRETKGEGGFRALFSAENWRATTFVCVFWFCAIAPYFAIATFSEDVLKNYGLSDGLAGGVGLTALAAAGVVVCTILVDKIGRRSLTIPPQWICAVALAVTAFWVGAPGPVVLACFFVFSFFNSMYQALTGVYPTEVFPTEIRGIGTGLGAAFSRIGAAAGTFLLPWSIDTYGIGASMGVAAGVVVVGALVSHWLAPEMAGRNLSEAKDAVKRAAAH
ncbi:MFS transporter [Kineococcus gynurae]|uniref:MFS transporter n=1 Tax=Kineococcus gynurae TaxID=452979 RepID=A0ABV5LQ33_9ACTN